jgi:hypothetical protein
MRSSETAWDSQTVLLPSDRHFEFTYLPVEKFTIHASVKDYHENTPLSGSSSFLIDHDIDNFITTIDPNLPQVGRREYLRIR